jgi:hypothetical protein
VWNFKKTLRVTEELIASCKTEAVYIITSSPLGMKKNPYNIIFLKIKYVYL